VRHGRRRKTRTHVRSAEADDGEASEKVPRSFVVRRGKVPHGVRKLVLELRSAMLPHTAARLKERSTNSLKDYVSVAGKLGVSHLLMFSATDFGVYLRLARMPRGPTLSFRVAEYSLGSEIKALQRRPVAMTGQDLQDPPLLVLHQFGAASDQMRIMKATFEHMFPALDVRTVNLSRVRRVLLVEYDPETELVHLRHYKVIVQPVGLSRSLRKLVMRHKVPKLAAMQDISDFVQPDAAVYSSESEPEPPESAHVVLPQDMPGGPTRKKGAKNAIKLVEEGPRLSLQLLKIEDGLCGGAVLYHKHQEKSVGEVRATEEKIEQNKARRAASKAMQESAVASKKDKLSRKTQKNAERKRKRRDRDSVRSGGARNGYEAE